MNQPYRSNLGSLLLGIRRKIFVNDHHAGDQVYYNEFSRFFAGGYEAVHDRSVACGDDAGGDGCLAYVRKFPSFHPLKDIRPIARNVVDQILATAQAVGGLCCS